MYFRKILFSFLLLLPIAAFASPEVDINSADSETLVDLLDGIGPQKAMAIVRYRQENGMFSSVEELTEVKGIGEKTLELNRERIKEIMPKTATK